MDSVEPDRNFTQLIEGLALDGIEVTLHFEPPVTNPRVKSGRSGSVDKDFAKHVGRIDRVSGKFDLIIIDRRARVACITPALARLNTRDLIL